MPSRAEPSRVRSRRVRAAGVWLIALAVALVATIQIRSEAEVQRTLSNLDATSLAFLIDDLHRANDSLDTERTALQAQRSALRTGGTDAADQVLTDEATRLRAIEGLAAVHGPGVVIVVDATGLTALDLEDAVNNLLAAGAEAIDVNGRRVVTGVAVTQTAEGVAVGGVAVPPPWRIVAIGDPARLAGVADLMTQQMRADRRVRTASFTTDPDVEIRSVVSETPFVYAVPS
jgi:uncharacterized protein YlxW (UPF0749 family)